MGTYVLIGALNAFHFLGALFAIWAVALTAVGVRSESFPRTSRQAWAVGAISVLLCVGAISSAIIEGALESDEEESEAAAGEAEQSAPPTVGAQLRLAADPSGQLKFDKSALRAKAGPVTIAMRNASTVVHNVSLEGEGVNEAGKLVKDGATSTVTARLKPGRYTFYCAVAGHRQAGMEGTLAVR